MVTIGDSAERYAAYPGTKSPAAPLWDTTSARPSVPPERGVTKQREIGEDCVLDRPLRAARTPSQASKHQLGRRTARHDGDGTLSGPSARMERRSRPTTRTHGQTGEHYDQPDVPAGARAPSEPGKE